MKEGDQNGGKKKKTLETCRGGLVCLIFKMKIHEYQAKILERQISVTGYPPGKVTMHPKGEPKKREEFLSRVHQEAKDKYGGRANVAAQGVKGGGRKKGGKMKPSTTTPNDSASERRKQQKRRKGRGWAKGKFFLDSFISGSTPKRQRLPHRLND